MESLKKNKILLIALVIVVAAALFYFFVLREEEPLIVSDISSPSDILGQDLVNELNRLKSLRNINTSLFASPLFVGLQDDTVPVQPKPIGRSNPFLPL